MKNFKVIVMAMFLFLSNAVLAQEGAVSSGLVKASLEDVLAKIKTDGRGKVSLSMSGNYYQKGSDGYGEININQKGDFFVQTITLNTDGDIVYGPQNKILNIFETKYQNAEYVFTGIHSVDLNQDGLHDIVVEIVNISAIPYYGVDIATSYDFYFATGNGQFAIGKSDVHF